MITQTEQYSNIKNDAPGNQQPAEAREAEQPIDRVNVERHALLEEGRVTHGPEPANHRDQDDGPTAMARESQCLPALPTRTRARRRHPRRTARGRLHGGRKRGTEVGLQQSWYASSGYRTAIEMLQMGMHATCHNKKMQAIIVGGQKRRGATLKDKKLH